MGTRNDTLEVSIALWELLTRNRVLIRHANRKKAAIVLRAYTYWHGPSRTWRYRLDKERAEELLTWYDKEGKLVAPEKLQAALWEKPQPKKRKPKAQDLLASYKAKLLAGNDS